MAGRALCRLWLHYPFSGRQGKHHRLSVRTVAYPLCGRGYRKGDHVAGFDAGRISGRAVGICRTLGRVRRFFSTCDF